MLTVKQISKLAHITPRTIHYYDQIGLLHPDEIGENGYRYYSDASLLKLQQILFYRELDMPLDQIKEIMSSNQYDFAQALLEHKKQLNKRITRINKLIATVDQTLKHIGGEEMMEKKELFEGFSPEEEAKMEQEALDTYDPETVKQSWKKWRNYSKDKQQSILDEGKEIYQEFVKAMPFGAESPQAQACVQHWRDHMDNFWTPNLEQLLGLADLYNNDPHFKQNYDKIHPDLAEFVRSAIQIYVVNNL
jgi:DNA-binding transcriptional MerR regulator